jgi:hypothetical protein
VNQVVQLLLALGVGGLLVEAVRALVQRRKMNADVADRLTNTALVLLAPLERRVHAADAEAERMREALTKAHTELEAMRQELRACRRMIAKLRGLDEDDLSE